MKPYLRWAKWPCSRNLYLSVAFIIAFASFCAMAVASHVIRYAPNPPYDSIPITPKNWEQVDLIYYSTISGHRYANNIQLLRPVAWINNRHMDIIGGRVTLSMPEFGIVNVMATVKAIKPTQIDTLGVDWSKQKGAPVIGKFKRYVTDVRTYTFKDSLGHISHINATPNHPFYVKNKHGFVAIGNVSDDDTLVGDYGFGDKHMDGTVHLVCAKGKHSHCGEAFMGNGLPVSVYNLEVYRRHVYRVGGGALLVHNGCDSTVADRDLLIKQLKIDYQSNPGNPDWNNGIIPDQPSEDLFGWRAAPETLEEAFEQGLMPTKYQSSIRNSLDDHVGGTTDGTRFVSISKSYEFAHWYAEMSSEKQSLIFLKINKKYAFFQSNSLIPTEEELSHIGGVPSHEIIGGFSFSRTSHQQIRLSNFEYNSEVKW